MTDSHDFAQAIFDYWKRTCDHPRARMDDKRRDIITKMLALGYTEDDLKLAVYGCRHSPFHQAQDVNNTTTVYDSIGLIFRNAEKVDQFMAVGETRIKRIRAQQAQRAELAPAANDRPADTPISRENRAALLSIVKKVATG
jgi:hypothetical protein